MNLPIKKTKKLRKNKEEINTIINTISIYQKNKFKMKNHLIHIRINTIIKKN